MQIENIDLNYELLTKLILKYTRGMEKPSVLFVSPLIYESYPRLLQATAKRLYFCDILVVQDKNLKGSQVMIGLVDDLSKI